MKVLSLKFSFKRWFLDVGSILQPVLFVVCFRYMAQYSMLSYLGGEDVWRFERRQRPVYTFSYLFRLFCSVLIHCFLISVSNSTSSASFVFSVLEVGETHQFL